MATVMTSRDRVRRFFEGASVDRMPIILHAGRYSARLQQLTYQQASADPTLLANAVQSALRLFGVDGIVLPADPTMEAEALGCAVAWEDDEPVVVSHPLAGEAAGAAIETAGMDTRGRVGVMLEVTRRLMAVIGRDVAVIPAVTGPATLAHLLRGPEFLVDLDDAPERARQIVEGAAKVTMHIAKECLEIGTGQLVVNDPLVGSLKKEHYQWIGNILRPLWNVADFFDALLLLETEVADLERVQDLLRLGAGGLLVGGGYAPAEVAGLGGDTACVAVGFPPSFFSRPPGELEPVVSAWYASGERQRGLLACGTLPRGAPAENVHEVLRVLRG